MKKWRVILSLVVLILGVSACGKNEESKTINDKGNTDVQTVEKEAVPTPVEPEKKYFSERSTLETPDSAIKGITYKEKDGDIYYYVLGQTEDDAQTSIRAWMAFLMSEDYSVSDMGNGTTFKVKKDGSVIAVYAVGHLDYGYVMGWSFH